MIIFWWKSLSFDEFLCNWNKVYTTVMEITVFFFFFTFFKIYFLPYEYAKVSPPIVLIPRAGGFTPNAIPLWDLWHSECAKVCWMLEKHVHSHVNWSSTSTMMLFVMAIEASQFSPYLLLEHAKVNPCWCSDEWSSFMKQWPLNSGGWM